MSCEGLALYVLIKGSGINNLKMAPHQVCVYQITVKEKKQIVCKCTITMATTTEKKPVRHFHSCLIFGLAVPRGAQLIILNYVINIVHYSMCLGENAPWES